MAEKLGDAEMSDKTGTGAPSPETPAAREVRVLADWLAPLISSLGLTKQDEIVKHLRAYAECLDRQEWQPMDRWAELSSALDDDEYVWWIVPKTAEESYVDTSGRPIMSDAPPRRVVGRYGCWPCLMKAVLFASLPKGPTR